MNLILPSNIPLNYYKLHVTKGLCLRYFIKHSFLNPLRGVFFTDMRDLSLIELVFISFWNFITQRKDYFHSCLENKNGYNKFHEILKNEKKKRDFKKKHSITSECMILEARKHTLLNLSLLSPC